MAAQAGVDPYDEEAMDEWLHSDPNEINVDELHGMSRYIYRLQYDDLLALQLQAAQLHHLPLSGFLEWEPEDQDAAIAYILHVRSEEASRCQSCGTREEDWVDPDSKRTYPFPQYEAVNELCYGCQALYRSRDDIQSEEREYVRPRIKAIE
jgi:hypothetical protein